MAGMSVSMTIRAPEKTMVATMVDGLVANLVA
jgi:hypothetical protein